MATPHEKALSHKSRKEITEQRLQHHWSTGKPLHYKSENRSVNRMSYGKYFLGHGSKSIDLHSTEKKKNVNEKGYRLTQKNTKGGNYQRHYSKIFEE